MNGELVAIDEGGLEPELLGGDDGLDRGFDFALDVVALVDHVGDSGAETVGKAGMDLVEDAEDLVGVDGAEGQIVVGIAAVVEVEAAEQAGVKKPGDNLLDVLRGVVVAGVDEDAGLRAGSTREWEDMPQSAMSV